MSYFAQLAIQQINRSTSAAESERMAFEEYNKRLESEVISDKYSNNFESLEEDRFDADCKSNLKSEIRHQLDGYHFVNFPHDMNPTKVFGHRK